MVLVTHIRPFPCQIYLRTFLAVNNGILRRSQVCLNGLLKRRNICRLPFTEIAVNDFDGMVVVKIAGKTDSYIIRAIIGLIELLDILQTRVLQVFLRT